MGIWDIYGSKIQDIQGTQQGHIPQHLPVAPRSLRGSFQGVEPALRVGAVVQAHHKHRGAWGLGMVAEAITSLVHGLGS